MNWKEPAGPKTFAAILVFAIVVMAAIMIYVNLK